MDRLSQEIRDRYYEGLKKFIVKENEEYLMHAYEMGRSAAQKGVSELDIITFHHEKLIELYNSARSLDYETKINRASNYLKECLAPFEVKLDSYRDVIDKLEEKNDQLEKEIEDRREAQEELLRSKEYFQSLIENAQDLISVLDHQGIVRFSSPSIERILGYSQQEMVGRDAFEYIHENDVERIREIFEKIISKPGTVQTDEFRFKHKDGRWIYLEAIAKNLEESSDGPIVIVNSRDVTQRKKAIRKLQDQQYQLAEAQKIAKVGSWVWKPGEDDLVWSDEMCRIFGVEPAKFDNDYDTFISLVHPEDRHRFENVLEDTLEGKGAFSIEHRVIRRDEEQRRLLCRGHVVTDEDGEIMKMIGTGQDITQQKAEEEKLREYSERLRNLSEKLERVREEERIRIARQVHDELGQMLTVLKMDVSMMRGEMQKKVTDETLEYFNTQAAKVLDRINVIIKSVQRITTELRPEVLDDLGLKEAIDWQASEFEKRTGIDVKFDSNFHKTDLLDDNKATTLFRIFQETLTNISRHADATKVKIELNRINGDLSLKVADNGIGITEEQKEASSSLGIIGIRERTKNIGGEVKIDGKRSEGTTIILQVPINSNL